jgi:hypothetical protein
MSNYPKSLNPCGRSINYPHFGAEKQYLVPPPGVDVNQSVCKKYYQTKDFNSTPEECKQCLYDQYSFDRSCPCELQSTNKPDLCSFAKCVSEQMKKPDPKCKLAYYALYNVDDVKDQEYSSEFSYDNLSGCF